MLLGFAGALGTLATPLACTTRIIPPARLTDPVAIFLVDQGRTASLVLPGESEGELVRWAYGDWNWYALGNTGLLSGIAALFWPTRGTLGRASLDGPATLARVRDQVRGDNVYAIHVERRAAGELLARLEAEYQQHVHTRTTGASGKFQFVHHPARYTYFSNSNHAVAQWLRAVGCRTRGPAIASRWRVD